MEYSIDGEFDGGLYGMTFKFEGFDVPSSINPSSIGLNVIEPASETGFDRTNSAGVYRAAFDDQNEVFTFNPATVSVSGTKVTITLPDVRPEGEVTKKAFDKGSNFRVLIYASAGISNPTEANTYGGLKGTADGDREIYVEFAAPGVSTIHFTAVGEEGQGHSDTPDSGNRPGGRRTGHDGNRHRQRFQERDHPDRVPGRERRWRT